MKIQLVSDLHMEFAPIEITNARADVLVLSGDIVVADYFSRSEASPLHAKGREWIDWFERTCAQFERVYYVLGNHEHYKGKFYDTVSVLRTHLGHIANLRILDNEHDLCGQYVVFGTTLWTNFDRGSFAAKSVVQSGLNDYRVIQGANYRKLRPDDTALYHQKALLAIDHTLNLASDKPLIVIGHHAPSYRSIENQYRTSGLLNFGYYSDLELFIFDRPQIKLWTHGHVHSSHDYNIGDTRVVANPRGYDRGYGPENKQFNSNLVLDV